MTSRRGLLKSLAVVGGAAALAPFDEVRAQAPATRPPMKITRVRYYHVASAMGNVFNQSMHVVTVDTDQGITGVGEGGSRDLIEAIAPLIVGQDPTRIEHL